MTGSFATARRRVERADARRRRSASPRRRSAAPRRSSRWIGFASLLGYLDRARLIVGRGPWGNMFEFSVAFATSIVGGYLYPPAPLPDPLDRLHPDRRRASPCSLYASSLPSDISQLVPALQNPPLITIHVGLAVLSYGIFATSLRRRRRLPAPGTARSVRVAAAATRSSMRSRTGRSSSASRSSRR